MSIKIANDSANGNVILKGQNVAGDVTLTMPNISTELAPRMQLMTAQNSTSGTSIDFTGIPSWAKRITVMFNGVSISGTSDFLVQLGAVSVDITSYVSTWSVSVGAVIATGNSTSGFIIRDGSASALYSGSMVLTLLASNTWICTGMHNGGATALYFTAGTKVLSGTLDRVRVTTVNGTDTFDAGQINVLYEG